MNIGQKIKSIADSKNVTAKDLAEKIGRTRQAVYDIYSGKVSVNVEQLEKICNALDIEVVALFIGDKQIRQSRDEIIQMMQTIFGKILEEGYFNAYHIHQLMVNLYAHASIGEALVNLKVIEITNKYDYPFIERYKPLKGKLADKELKELYDISFKNGPLLLTQIMTYSNYDQLISDYIRENYNKDN